MRKLTSFILFLFVTIGLVTQANAQQAGLLFLKMSPDARGSGLAGALVASTEDSSSLYWNPSGLAAVKGNSAIVTFNSYIQGSTFIYGAFAKKLPVGTVGVGATILSFGESVTYESLLSEGIIQKNSALAFSAGYGTMIGTWIDVGATAKYAMESINDTSVNGVMFDLGLKMHYLQDRILVGLLAQNVGFASETAPVNFRIGGSMQFDVGQIGILPMIETDLHLNSPSTSANIASEFSYAQKMFFRIGYKLNLSGMDLGDVPGITMGLGAKHSIFKLDLAWVPMGSLGHTTIFTFSMDFGNDKTSAPAKTEIKEEATTDVPSGDKEDSSPSEEKKSDSLDNIDLGF